MRFLKYGLSAAIMCFGGTVTAAAQSYSYNTEIHMVVEPSDTPVGEERTVSAAEPVLAARAYSPRSVRLDEKVTVGIIGSGVSFEEGTVLFGRYDDAAWTYCGIAGLDASSRLASAAVLGVLTAGTSLLLEPMRGQEVNCLYDEDNDGRFDSAWGGGISEYDSAFLAWTLTSKTISGTPAYSRVGLTEGPMMPIEITWNKNNKTGLLHFYTETSGKSVKTSAIALPAEGEEPVTHNQFGATFEIISYDAELDQLTYRVAEGSDRQYVRIPAQKTVTTTYY